MKKTLITEINRIQELMGKPLITEQKVITKVIDELAILLAKTFKNIDGTLKKLIDDLNSPKNTNDVKLNILTKLSKANKKMEGMIIPRVMNSLPQNVKDQISKFKDDIPISIKNIEAKGGKVKNVDAGIDKFLNNMTGLNDDIRFMLKKYFTDYADKFLRDSPSPVVRNPKPKTIEYVMGQGLDDIKPLSNNDFIKLGKLYRQTGLGKSFIMAMRQFSEDVINMINKDYKLMDENLSLIKEFITTKNPTDKFAIGKKIGDNLQTLVSKDKRNHAYINTWIDDNIKDIAIKRKLKTLSGYEKAASVFDGTALKKWKARYKSMPERRWELTKQLNSLINPYNWFPKSVNKHYGSYGDKVLSLINPDSPKFGEFRRFASLGQTQSLEGINEYRKLFGFLPAIKNIAKEQLWSYGMLAVAYGFVDYVTDLIGNVFRNSETVTGFLRLQDDIKSYDEHFKDKPQDSGTIKAVRGGKGIFSDMLIYSTEALLNLNTAFPGLIDDFLALWEDFRFGEITEEKMDNLEKKGIELKQKLTDRMKNIQDGSEKILDKGKEIFDINGDKIDDNIKDSKLGFRLWCQKNNKEFVDYDAGYGSTKENNKIIYWEWSDKENTFIPYKTN
jgi:hypothetical protein